MDKQATLDKLKKLQQEDDTEQAHYYADQTIIDFLCELDHYDVAEEYKKIPKWYS